MLKPISTRIDEETFLAFEHLCHETHIPKSRLIREGIKYVIKKYSNLDKKLELAQAIEEAEEDLKSGKIYDLKEVDEMLDEVAEPKPKKEKDKPWN